MASASDLLQRTFNSANPNVARVTATRVAAGATLTCDNLSGWPTGTGVSFSTYRIDTNNDVVAGTQIDWVGVVTSSTTIGSLTRVAGATDAGSAIGDVVEMNPTATWADRLVQAVLTHSDQDGTLKAGAVDGVGVFASGVISSTAPFATAYNPETRLSENTFDYVASGCVWSGDSYGSTRAASMTSGVLYIGGKRVTVAAVTARSFTASKDTYIDVDNAGTITYTEVANNAASPALSASNIRLGIIVTGAGNIANAGSVNQGQETMVLPIASSIPYAVTDSLGNLICPRDPNRRVLGYRQITSDSSSASTSAAAITGLSVPVIVPSGRKVKVTFYSWNVRNNTGGSNVEPSIWDTSTAGTKLQAGRFYSASANYTTPVNLEVLNTPTATSKTFIAAQQVDANTGTIGASATTPAFLKVELA